jgi:hypothetical protein
MLPCGHSFCGDCLTLLYKPSESAVNCPTCLVSHKVGPKENLENFSKNFALIALAESKHSNAPLLQMRMGLSGTDRKRKKLVPVSRSSVSDLSLQSNLEPQRRQRINSDIPFEVSRSMLKSEEECKSEDEVRRVIETSSSEEIKEELEKLEDSSTSSDDELDPRQIPRLKHGQLCASHN